MTKELQLTKGYVALVDDSDYEYLSRWKWTYSGGYALRRQVQDGRKRTIMLHRQITNAPDFHDVDHRDLNPLNNQRYNLRVCSRSQNCANRPASEFGTSKFKGVSLRRDRIQNPWRATIACKNQQFSIGAYPTEIQAARAYDEKARELFGEFAFTNFP